MHHFPSASPEPATLDVLPGTIARTLEGECAVYSGDHVHRAKVLHIPNNVIELVFDSGKTFYLTVTEVA